MTAGNVATYIGRLVQAPPGGASMLERDLAWFTLLLDGDREVCTGRLSRLVLVHCMEKESLLGHSRGLVLLACKQGHVAFVLQPINQEKYTSVS